MHTVIIVIPDFFDRSRCLILSVNSAICIYILDSVVKLFTVNSILVVFVIPCLTLIIKLFLIVIINRSKIHDTETIEVSLISRNYYCKFTGRGIHRNGRTWKVFFEVCNSIFTVVMSGPISVNGDIKTRSIKRLPRLNLILNINTIINIGFLVIHIKEPANMVSITWLHIPSLIVENTSRSRLWFSNRYRSRITAGRDRK